MPQIRLRLIDRSDRVHLAHLAEPQSRNLRKDEPHPVPRLAPAPQFRTRLLVCALLRLNKTLKIVRIVVSQVTPRTEKTNDSTLHLIAVPLKFGQFGDPGQSRTDSDPAMRLKFTLLFVIASCVPLTLRADDTSKIAKVHEFFKIAKIDQAANVAMNTTITRVNTRITQQLNGVNVTVARQQRVDQLNEKLKKLIVNDLSWDSLEPEYTKLYADAYTEQQLDDLIAFYKTPTGQAVAEKTPILAGQISNISQERLAALLPQIQQIVRDFVSTPTITGSDENGDQ